MSLLMAGALEKQVFRLISVDIMCGLGCLFARKTAFEKVSKCEEVKEYTKRAVWEPNGITY